MKSLFILSILFFAHFNAFAKPPYLNELATAYPGSQVINTTKCQTCHNNGKALNVFGTDYSKIVRLGGLERSEAFKKLGLIDSDNDGVSNLEELLKGTNPGKADAKAQMPATNEAQVTYYYGLVTYYFPDGKTVLGSSHSLVKRTIDPSKKLILELVSQASLKDSTNVENYETIFSQVDLGSSFTVEDTGKTFSGVIKFSGEDWKWTAWDYNLTLSDGEKLTGNGRLDEQGISVRKYISRADGNLRLFIQELLQPITEEQYNNYRKAMFPNGH